MAERKPLVIGSGNRPAELPAGDNLPYSVLPQAWTHPSLGAPLGSMLIYAAIARGENPPDTFAFWATETADISTDALVTITGTGYLGFDLVNSDRARANLGLGSCATLDVDDLISTDTPNALEIGADGKLVATGGGGGQVGEVQAGDFIDVDDTDPTQPIVSVPISGGPPNEDDPVVSDGAGGLKWGERRTDDGRDIRIPFSGVTDGDVRYVYVPDTCSIVGVTGLFGPSSGDADIDILVGGYSAFPTGAVEHNIAVSSAQKYKSGALSILVGSDSFIGLAFDSMASITEGEVYLHIASTAARKWWRVYITTTAHATVAACAELEFRTLPGGSSVVGGGTPFASSSHASGPVANAYDGNTSTLWHSNGSFPHHIGYEFASPVVINEIAWRSRADLNTQNPVNFVIQSSLDGSSWADEWGVTGSTGWTNGLQRVFTRP